MIRPPFVFERRSKHPAHNATNALLNLGYVLLGNEIASRLEAAGFDPRIGYFHGLRYATVVPAWRSICWSRTGAR